MTQSDVQKAFAEVTQDVTDLQSVATTAATVLNTAAQQLVALDKNLQLQHSSGSVDVSVIRKQIADIRSTLFQAAQDATTALTATAADAAPITPEPAAPAGVVPIDPANTPAPAPATPAPAADQPAPAEITNSVEADQNVAPPAQ